MASPKNAFFLGIRPETRTMGSYQRIILFFFYPNFTRSQTNGRYRCGVDSKNLRLINLKPQTDALSKEQSGESCTSHLISPRYCRNSWGGNNECGIVRRTPPLEPIIAQNNFSYADDSSGGTGAKEIAVWRALAASQPQLVLILMGK